MPDNTNSSYIECLYIKGLISEEEYQYLQYLLTTSDHVPGSERMIIMEILEEKISYYRNTRDINSLGYQWIQRNLAALDLYLEENGLKWPEVIKQHVLSEYYNMYIGDNTSALLMAGVELVLCDLDWEKCQELYDTISTDYIYIIWYGNPMQIKEGDSDGEQYLAVRIEGNDKLRGLWDQDKTDQLWTSCEQIYDEYGIAIDPRILLAIIIQEGTGSFNTSSANPAADGGNGPHPEYDQDLENAIDLILGKTLGYIFYNKQFGEAAESNSDSLENSTGNIFEASGMIVGNLPAS